MSNGLKPCPCCCSRELRVFYDAIDIEFNTKSVICGDCCTKAPLHNWNTRTESTELERLRKENESLKRLDGLIIMNENGDDLDWEIDEGCVVIYNQ